MYLFPTNRNVFSCLQTLPVSSGWRYGYDTVLMHRYIQGDSLYIPERFGVAVKLYVEVRGTWCFTAKDLNGQHHHRQQVWCSIKIFITFHHQGQTMILTDCEVCGVESVRGGRYNKRYANISKWWPKIKMADLVFGATLSACMCILV